MGDSKGETKTLYRAVVHGAAELPAVFIESYSEDIKDKDRYFGERVSNGAFRELFERLRQQLREADADPLDGETDALNKKVIDKLLLEGKPEQAGLILSAIEEFANNLAKAAHSLLRLKSWADVSRIVVGGGFRESRVGELVVGRAGVLLKAKHPEVDIQPIRFHPDEAGLLGCAHLAPSWIFKGHDCLIAVDIGGSNFRCGLVELNLEKSPTLAAATVLKSRLWRHADEEPDRESATRTLGKMIDDLLEYGSKKNKRIAPFIGMGCPGTVLEDGKLKGGILNLPGNWGAKNFNLVDRVREMIPTIDKQDTIVALHNDAVVQGLSELPFMQDAPKWAVLTIGTGLGNACFRNKTNG